MSWLTLSMNGEHCGSYHRGRSTTPFYKAFPPCPSWELTRTLVHVSPWHLHASLAGPEHTHMGKQLGTDMVGLGGGDTS